MTMELENAKMLMIIHNTNTTLNKTTINNQAHMAMAPCLVGSAVVLNTKH